MHATHLFDAMAPVHHRRPGPVTATLTDDRVYLDTTRHPHPPALVSLVARVTPEHLVIVTDAIGATGTKPSGCSPGRLEVVVKDGRAVLAGHEETIAGSILTMDRAVALAVHVASVPVSWRFKPLRYTRPWPLTKTARAG